MPDKPPVESSASHRLKAQGGLPGDPAQDDQGSNNAASNGYWIHDDVGPKHYVAPPNANGLDVDEGDLVARIDAEMRRIFRPDASRLHVALDQGVVILCGIAVSEMESRLITRAVQTIAGQLRVVNRLVIDESMRKNRASP